MHNSAAHQWSEQTVVLPIPAPGPLQYPVYNIHKHNISFVMMAEGHMHAVGTSLGVATHALACRREPVMLGRGHHLLPAGHVLCICSTFFCRSGKTAALSVKITWHPHDQNDIHRTFSGNLHRAMAHRVSTAFSGTQSCAYSGALAHEEDAWQALACSQLYNQCIMKADGALCQESCQHEGRIPEASTNAQAAM